MSYFVGGKIIESQDLPYQQSYSRVSKNLKLHFISPSGHLEPSFVNLFLKIINTAPALETLSNTGTHKLQFSR